jgi:hypothetical protein
MFSTAWKDKTGRENLREFSYNFGYEIVFIKTFSLRQGFIGCKDNPFYDMIYSPGKEMHWGAGISIYNHFQVDWSYIYSPKGSIARDGQWSVSFLFYNIAFWSKDDGYWWRTKEKKPEKKQNRKNRQVEKDDTIIQEEDEEIIDNDDEIIDEQDGELIE